MSLTKDEAIALAKGCRAYLSPSYDDIMDEVDILFTQPQFIAYTSAIEEKYQAQIAMLVDALTEAKELLAHKHDEPASNKLNALLADTQATAEEKGKQNGQI